MKRLFAYRVYFGADDGTYYVVSAGNARGAIRRARQVRKAFHGRPSPVRKVERLFRGCRVRSLRTAV